MSDTPPKRPKPPDSGVCPGCGETAEFNQFAGRWDREEKEMWHKDCWVESDGYEPIAEDEDAPRCSNCNGFFTHRKPPSALPLPDACGEVGVYACATFFNRKTTVTVETPVREFTTADWDFLESVAHTDHWFGEFAARIHPDLTRRRGGGDR